MQAGQTQAADILSSGLANIESNLEQSRSVMQLQLHVATRLLNADAGVSC